MHKRGCSTLESPLAWGGETAYPPVPTDFYHCTHYTLNVCNPNTHQSIGKCEKAWDKTETVNWYYILPILKNSTSDRPSLVNTLLTSDVGLNRDLKIILGRRALLSTIRGNSIYLPNKRKIQTNHLWCSGKLNKCLGSPLLDALVIPVHV